MASVLTSDRIRQWDKFTIEKEGIASIELMERAARACVDWIKKEALTDRSFVVFCGKGNNGGDGLAIARLLSQLGCPVSVFVLDGGKRGSDDFESNLVRLEKIPNGILHFMQSKDDLPVIEKKEIVIDALFGSGLNRALSGLAADTVHHLNQSGASIIAVDLPSGLFPDRSSQGNAVITATHTLTFQCYKLGLLVQENAEAIGCVHVLDIGLQPDYLKIAKPEYFLTDADVATRIFKPRKRFSHKGSFGHALVVGGSYGKMGAVVLSARACAMTGAGLTTAVVPKCGYEIMQTALPEVMVMADEEEAHLANLPNDIEKFTIIGVGPGMGTHAQTQNILSFLIHRYRKPLVIDADGLNCLSLNKDWLTALPPQSVLTPHPKEFDRLFGDHTNDFSRIETAQQKAKELDVIIVLKSHHSLIALPDGTSFFNSTGNAGMAKGGSGDALTGIITSLIAQGYVPSDAAILGVYIHGWAGDVAARRYSAEAMLPSHLIECLPEVFLALSKAELHAALTR